MNMKKKEIKEDLKWIIKMVAQADTNSVIQNTGSRGQILINTAKTLTEKYNLFKYWRE